MSAFVKLSYEAWKETYKPIDNPFAPGSQLFQIPCSDAEREFLRTIDASRIWSYGSGDFGGTFVWSGEVAQGLENFGAYVTEVGYEGDSIVEIEVLEPPRLLDRQGWSTLFAGALLLLISFTTN